MISHSSLPLYRGTDAQYTSILIRTYSSNIVVLYLDSYTLERFFCKWDFCVNPRKMQHKIFSVSGISRAFRLFPSSHASTKRNEKHKNINLCRQSPKNIIIRSTNFVDFKLLFQQRLKRFHVDVAFERFLDETQKFLKFFIHAAGISENVESLRKIFKMI